MERNNFTKKLARRLAVYAALAVLLYGALASFYNPHTRALTEGGAQPLNILILTEPPIFISYNPQRRKAAVTNIAPNKKAAKAADILKAAGINPAHVLYIAPSTKQRAAFWEAAKNNLLAWHKKPYIIFAYIYQYAGLRLARRTNIAPSDFIMITFELARLTPADFTVKNPEPKPQQQPAQIMLAQDAPAPQTSKTLVLEILNASGRAGLAAEVTRYLRDLSNSGILDVDVINYASYPSTEQKTKITDIAGRPEDLKKIARELGLNNHEIFTAADKTAISDAKIILGADFAMPSKK